MDAMSSSDSSPADVYFVLKDSEYVINAVNFDLDKKIPIGFKNTKQANFKITVSEIVNVPTVNAFIYMTKIKRYPIMISKKFS
jgi:hypothetical protein